MKINRANWKALTYVMEKKAPLLLEYQQSSYEISATTSLQHRSVVDHGAPWLRLVLGASYFGCHVTPVYLPESPSHSVRNLTVPHLVLPIRALGCLQPRGSQSPCPFLNHRCPALVFLLVCGGSLHSSGGHILRSKLFLSWRGLSIVS